jgi:hypothetical protein
VRHYSIAGAFLCQVLLCLFSTLASAAISCPNANNAPNTYGFCGEYAAPMIACQTKAGTTGCSKLPIGWTENIGFYTKPPAAGTVGSQFPGISYAQLVPAGQPYNTPNANGAVGLTDIMEYVNNGVQAFNKNKGTAVFIVKGATTPSPQLPNGPFASFSKAPLTQSCGNLSIDVNITYDHQANMFMLSGITNSASPNTPAICIAVSSDLENGGQSWWFSYGFNLTTLQVSDGGIVSTFDYPRIGTFGSHYYIAMDYIDENQTSPDYHNILGYVVCSLDRADIIQGLPAKAAQCYSYVPSRTTDRDALVHSLLPADMESTSVAAGTAGPYFFAQVNPWEAGTQWWAGNPCYQSYSCATSMLIASWNWAAISSGGAPTSTTTWDATAMPGCYDPWSPDNTVCVTQPSPAGATDQLDANSDRLSGRVPYLAANWSFAPVGPQAELMAVTTTGWDQGSSIRSPNQMVYGFVAGTGGYFVNVPSISYSSSPSGANAWNASVAINSAMNLGAIFTIDNPGGSLGTPNPPSIYSDVEVFNPSAGSWSGNPNVLVTQGEGVSIEDSQGIYVQDWGNYVSVGVDPSDNTTFWGVNEYLTANQTPEALTWATTIFKFKQ